MTLVLAMLAAQSLLGAFDNLWHHEISERLPQKPKARTELALHSIREFLYAVIFTSIAWVRWEGAFAFLLVAILAIEIVVTLADFVVEDRTRQLPKLERILHTVLAINFGATFALWAPELIVWAKQPTGFPIAYYGIWSWLFTGFGAGVFLWSVRNAIAVVKLGVPAWRRNPMRVGISRNPHTVLVTGATGFIGRALVRALLARGDKVIALTRDADKARDVLGPFVNVVDDLDGLDSGCRIDAIVNLAGEPLAGGLWTRRRKQLFVQSRVAVTSGLERLVRRLVQKPAVLVSGSAIGFYGDRGSEVLTEHGSTQDIFMSSLCEQWENAANRMEDHGVRVCRLRIGLVLDRDGGVLPSMALPMRFGVSAQFGCGQQWMSWIHLDDLVRLIVHAIEKPSLSGAVNAVSPEPVMHRDFVRSLGERFGHQIRVMVPAKAIRLALGELSTLFLASQRVVPVAATRRNFQFRFATLDAALADIYPAGEFETVGKPPIAYVNDACPVCSTEFGHYEAFARRRGAAFEVRLICDEPRALESYGIDESELRRRLYVMSADGKVTSGVDALLVTWRQLPYYRRLARVMHQPGLYDLADCIYEGVIVPVLGAWNRRRATRLQRHCALN